MITMLTGLAAGTLRRVPRAASSALLLALALALAVLLGWRWHATRVDTAFAAGAAAQAVADRARFAAAAAAATRSQAELRAALAARQILISKGSDDALVARNADLVRDFDDLRLRWKAHRAGERGAGAHRPTAVPAATGGADDAACAAAGWVSFDVAATAAQGADLAIAKDDAWIAWAAAQMAAWPNDGSRPE